MSITLKVYDGVTPILDEILKVNYGVAKESLSIAGDAVRKGARNAMKQKMHHWHTEYVDGKRQIRKREDAKELGLRIAKGGGIASPDSMANMITSYIGENSLTMVVGGKHKAATLIKYKDGKPNGTIKLFAVSKATHAILHKLNFGERNEFHTWNGPKESMARFANARYIGYKFMEQGYSDTKAYIEDIMGEKYASLFHKSVNNIDVKLKEVRF